MHRLLFALEAEGAHELALRLLSFWSERGPLLEAPARLLRVEDPRLRVEAFGVSFPNPLGLAAGMDKDARALGPGGPWALASPRWGPHPEAPGGKPKAEALPPGGGPGPHQPDGLQQPGGLGGGGEAKALPPKGASPPFGGQPGEEPGHPLGKAAEDYLEASASWSLWGTTSSST